MGSFMAFLVLLLLADGPVAAGAGTDTAGARRVGVGKRAPALPALVEAVGGEARGLLTVSSDSLEAYALPIPKAGGV